MNHNTTYILGFWHIKENTKRDLHHYITYIPRTLELLGPNKIVFFYEDDSVLEFINAHKKTVQFKAIKVKITDLPTYAISEDYLESCKSQDIISLRKINIDREKGLIHYERDYQKSGEESFRKLFTIWTSKLFLVKQIAEENPFKSDYFAWVDVSISRCSYNRVNWNFMAQEYSNRYIYHYSNVMKMRGKILNLSAGFIFGCKNKILKLVAVYEKQLKKSKNSDYGHDEETIIDLIYEKNKNLFCKIDMLGDDGNSTHDH